MTLRTLPFGPAVAASLRPLADPVLSERPLWPRGNPAVLYLASLGSASARRTMRSAVGNLAGLLGCDSFEAAPWPLLRYAHVVALRAALVSLRFAPATVNRHLAALRGVVRQAWLLGYIAPDDYQRMSDIPGVRGTRLLTGRALSYPELEALFAACADGTPAGHRDAALVALLFSAGLRRAEASSLLLADIDVDSWTIRLLGKGNHEREVPLRGGGRDALERWLIERGRTPGPLLCRVPLGGYVLPDCGLSPEGLRRRLIYRARRAAIPPCTPHDLRRTFVTRLLDHGIDLAVVGRMAGHRQVQTTMRYDRRNARAAEAAAELLDTPYRVAGSRAETV